MTTRATDNFKDTMSRSNWTDDKLLSRLCNNKSVKSRWDNIRVLRKRPSEELFFKCVELTKSKDPKIRSIGIDILAQLGVTPRPFLKQTLKLYFDLLNVESDPEILMSLLYAIGHNNDKLNKTQIEKLCTFSDNDNNLVKEALVSSLGFINDLKAIDVLIKFSTDKLSHIRDWATFYVGQVDRNNKNIREALWARINDKHQDTKLEAIVGLATRKDTRINDIIKRELLDGEYGTLLFEAIIETGDKQFLPLLRQNLKLAKTDTSINPEWIKDLKDCIDKLKKLNDSGERTTA
jgi:HEAT repeat protein